MTALRLVEARQEVLARIDEAVREAEARICAASTLAVPPKSKCGRWRGPETWGGEWDWWFALSPAERRGIVYWKCGRDGLAPDQIVEILGGKLGLDNLDDVMTEWVRATRISRAGRSLLKGHFPSRGAYSGRTVTDIFPDCGYDIGRLFSGDAEEYIAELEAAEADLWAWREEVSAGRAIASEEELIA
jgi:hypothetical protein